MGRQQKELTKSSKRACSLNCTIFAVLLTVLATFSFIGIGIVHSECRSNSFVVMVTQESSNVTIHFIDVGQGDSIFIDTSNKDVLIDGGPKKATVLDYLSSLNITHIHLMIATHVHADHIRGLVGVLNSTINVDEILINNQSCTKDFYVDFMSLAQSHTITVAQRGQTFLLTETANLTVFNPVQPLEFTGSTNDDENNNSVVVKLQFGNTSFLFAGDAQASAEQSMHDAGLELQSDILKVGHHGSRNATTQTFLDQVAPSYAIISAGKNNSYHHPHNETIQRLLAKGVTIYGTFQSGTIIASTNGTSIIFHGNPQPIPELQSSIVLPIFIVTTLLVAIVYKRKRYAESKNE